MTSLSAADRIVVLPNNTIEIRIKTVNYSAYGIQISCSYATRIIASTDNYANEDQKVQNLCAVIFAS